MKLSRLIFACYNVFPGATKIKVLGNTGKLIYHGVWNNGFRRFESQCF